MSTPGAFVISLVVIAAGAALCGLGAYKLAETLLHRAGR